MRRKLFIGGLAVVAAVFVPSGLGPDTSLHGLPCPASQLQTACGGASLVVATACGASVPHIGTIGPITINNDQGGAIITCPV